MQNYVSRVKLASFFGGWLNRAALRRGFRSPARANLAPAAKVRGQGFAVLGGLHLLQPGGCAAPVLLVQFDPDKLAAKLLRCDKRRAGTSKRIKHRALRGAEGRNDRL